jgi:hypothetical protein
VNKIFLAAVALTALLLAHPALAADPAERDTVKQLILARDAEFWAAYNSCDTSHYDRFFTRDVEFYHDRGGVTLGLEALVETIRKNLCNGSGPHLRRDPLPETTHLSLLENGSDIYGAVLTGEHLFFAIEPGQPPRPDSHARYVHLWLKIDGEFKMARVLSYDHVQAPAAPSPPIVALSAAQLDRCVGKFSAPKSGEILVAREDDHLALTVGGKHLPIYPADETTFVLKDRDVSFEFRFVKGMPEKLIVREHGVVAEEALPLAAK